jgi:hypothetical protein
MVEPENGWGKEKYRVDTGTFNRPNPDLRELTVHTGRQMGKQSQYKEDHAALMNL